eukprot:5130551-Pleurochrysis_carterae.AAC.1
MRSRPPTRTTTPARAGAHCGNAKAPVYARACEGERGRVQMHRVCDRERLRARERERKLVHTMRVG